MGKEIDIARAKELRGEILKRLYDVYGEPVALNTIRNILRYKSYYSENDIKRAVSYLSGRDRDYIHIGIDASDYWGSQVQLTPAGVNLVEGDNKDVGVLIDE